MLLPAERTSDRPPLSHLASSSHGPNKTLFSFDRTMVDVVFTLKGLAPYEILGREI